MSIADAQKLKELERRIAVLEATVEALKTQPRAPQVDVRVIQNRQPLVLPPDDDDPLMGDVPPRGAINRRGR